LSLTKTAGVVSFAPEVAIARLPINPITILFIIRKLKMKKTCSREAETKQHATGFFYSVPDCYRLGIMIYKTAIP
jgi:hypothetical protein